MMSKERRWPGGDGRITVEGKFLQGSGVSTAVTLLHIEDGPDGRWRSVRTFHEPGRHDIALSPGRYHFDISGPEGLPWEARARFDVIEKPPKQQGATLTDRIEAIEARLGKAGLDA